MYEQAIDDWVYHAIVKGRLALAFVSARAEQCPQRMCGRRRRCIARFGPKSNFHTTIGSCPNMSEAEWRIVSAGMQHSLKLLKAYLYAQDAAAMAKAPKRKRLSPEELSRRWNSPEAVAKRAEAERRRLADPGTEYWKHLWREVCGEHLTIPRDVRAANRRLIDFMAARSCRCAVERRMDGCGELAGRCERAPSGAAPDKEG